MVLVIDAHNLHLAYREPLEPNWVDWYNTPRQKLVKARHLDLANTLFADMHVEGRSIESLEYKRFW